MTATKKEYIAMLHISKAIEELGKTLSLVPDSEILKIQTELYQILNDLKVTYESKI